MWLCLEENTYQEENSQISLSLYVSGGRKKDIFTIQLKF